MFQTLHRGHHRLSGGCNGRIQVDHHRTILLGGAQQTLAFNHHLVVLGNDVGKGGIGKAHIDWNHLVGVVGIHDIFPQIVDQTKLIGVFGALLVVFRIFLQSNLGIGAQIGQSGTLLIVGQFVFCRTQFFIDDTDTLVDELGCTQGYLVLVLIGFIVIDGHQGIQEIDAAQAVGVMHEQLDNGSEL